MLAEKKLIENVERKRNLSKTYPTPLDPVLPGIENLLSYILIENLLSYILKTSYSSYPISI